MFKAKLFFPATENKANYGYLLHQTFLIQKFIESFLIANLIMFSKVKVISINTITLVYFSFFTKGSNQEGSFCISKFFLFSFFYFIEKHLSFLVMNNLPVRFIVKPILTTTQVRCKFSAQFFSLLLKNILEGSQQHQKVFFEIDQFISNKFFSSVKPFVKGFCVVFKGRLGGSDRSKKKVFCFGKASQTFFDSKTDFCKSEALTPHGLVSIKVWIFYN